jgi:hypothetical protein
VIYAVTRANDEQRRILASGAKRDEVLGLLSECSLLENKKEKKMKMKMPIEGRGQEISVYLPAWNNFDLAE